MFFGPIQNTFTSKYIIYKNALITSSFSHKVYVLIMQSIGYANLANLDPQYGLCKFFFFVYDHEQY